MVAIALAGYVVNYFLSLRFVVQPEITVVVLGTRKIYSRMGHGLAFAAILPAIFVQVPDGLAVQSSPFAGIEGANANFSSVLPLPSGILVMVYSGLSMFQFAIGAAIGLFFFDGSGGLIAYAVYLSRPRP